MSLFRKDVLFKIPWRPLIVLGLKWYESSIIFNALHAHWSILLLLEMEWNLEKNSTTKDEFLCKLGLLKTKILLLLCFSLVVYKIHTCTYYARYVLWIGKFFKSHCDQIQKNVHPEKSIAINEKSTIFIQSSWYFAIWIYP